MNNPDAKFLIVDPGSTHLGDTKKAKELIKYAYESGVQFCKFQLWTDPQVTARGNHCLSFEQFEEILDYSNKLQAYCRDKMEVTASVFDESCLDFLLKIRQIKTIKLAYSRRHRLDWVSKIQNAGKLPIVSSNVLEVHQLPQKDCVKLFCIPEYPVLYKVDFKGIFENHPCLFNGFSDHTLGIEQTFEAAFYPKCEWVEKHIKLPERSFCPDAQFAIDPKLLNELTKLLGFKNR